MLPTRASATTTTRARARTTRARSRTFPTRAVARRGDERDAPSRAHDDDEMCVAFSRGEERDSSARKIDLLLDAGQFECGEWFYARGTLARETDRFL